MLPAHSSRHRSQRVSRKQNSRVKELVHSKEMRLNLHLALLLPRLERLHCRKKEEVGIMGVNINKAFCPKETSDVFNTLFQKTIPGLVKTCDYYCTVNSSGQAASSCPRQRSNEWAYDSCWPATSQPQSGSKAFCFD